jgi:hypothetical protein
VTLFVYGVSGPGSHSLGDQASGSNGWYIETTGLISQDFMQRWYYTSATNPGSLVLTEVDIPNRSVAGTFRFSARSVEGAVAFIEEGAFHGRLELN